MNNIVWPIIYIIVAIVGIYLGIKHAIKGQEVRGSAGRKSYLNPNCTYPFHLDKDLDHCISYAYLVHERASKAALEENCKSCQYSSRKGK